MLLSLRNSFAPLAPIRLCRQFHHLPRALIERHSTYMFGQSKGQLARRGLCVSEREEEEKENP